MKINWQGTVALPPLRAAQPDGVLTEEHRRDWWEIRGLNRPAGRRRDALYEERNRLFGVGNWRQAWRLGDRIIDRCGAVAEYEASYFRFFSERPAELDWLCHNASEVFDDAESNIDSGGDYAVQETESTHLQDIAVRRCVVRCGRRLEGSRLIEIRSRDAEGFRLSPGVIGFHSPALILPSDQSAWWASDSVEAFWQNNKILLVARAALRASPAFAGRDGIWAALDEHFAVFCPTEVDRVLSAAAISVPRRLWGETPENRTMVRLVPTQIMPVSDIFAIRTDTIVVPAKKHTISLWDLLPAWPEGKVNDAD